MSARSLSRIIASAGIVAVVATLAACAPADSTPSASESAAPATPTYVTDGKLTIATGDQAFFPYVLDNKPESGEGFESAVAYAVADQLGFAKEDVVWVSTGFEEAIQPGPKNFDFNIQQYSITPEREATVDFSPPYYSTPQAVVTIEGTPADGVTTIAGLKDVVVGAQTGTTSFTTAESVIQPSGGVQAFNSNDDAKLALQNGTIDALVVDLPTAFYLTGVDLKGGVLVGQLPASDGISDDWGLLLDKDSSLTATVSNAVNALREDGTLDELAEQWLGSDAGATVLG